MIVFTSNILYYAKQGAAGKLTLQDAIHMRNDMQSLQLAMQLHEEAALFTWPMLQVSQLAAQQQQQYQSIPTTARPLLSIQETIQPALSEQQQQSQPRHSPTLAIPTPILIQRTSSAQTSSITSEQLTTTTQAVGYIHEYRGPTIYSSLAPLICEPICRCLCQSHQNGGKNACAVRPWILLFGAKDPMVLLRKLPFVIGFDRSSPH